MPCPSHPPWLYHPHYIWRRLQRSSSLYSSLQLPIISPLFGPNIVLSTLFCNNFGLCSSLNVRDQVSHPYKTTDKIIVSYVLILKFFDRKR
jgi:hypothetical protein